MNVNPMIVTIVIMIFAMWFISRMGRKQQERMRAEQERRTNEALVPGNWVRTRAGFYGTVVEVSGDVVTLATPLGDESLWAKETILGSEEPPFAAEDSAPSVEDAGSSAEEDEEGEEAVVEHEDSDVDSDGTEDRPVRP